MATAIGRISTRRVWLGFAVATCALLGVSSQSDAPREVLDKLSYPKTVIVVRHAEKAAEPKNDPVLSEEGVARAERLAKLLAKAGVTHLFATEFQRTQQTLAPLSLATGTKVSLGNAADFKATHSAVASLPRDSVAVIAAHSNTVPALLELLSAGRAKISLGEADYDRLFVVTQWGPDKQSTWLELRY